jgi:phosphoadenosine phosphosulfate reductase
MLHRPSHPFRASDTSLVGSPSGRLRGRIARLNAQYAHSGATEVFTAAMSSFKNLAMVSSFGADSVVLLHLAAQINKDIPVLFIDTELLFDETLRYQVRVSRMLGFTNVRVLRASDLHKNDPANQLHKTDPDACCHLRKTVPLNAALGEFDGWISGRKRHQSGTRARLNMFEVEDSTQRIKVNPLALWNSDDMRRYMNATQLPRHPLVAKGYPSIGCEPCTTPVAEGEDPRAGRWRETEKEECGIHFVDGKMVRSGEPT